MKATTLDTLRIDLRRQRAEALTAEVTRIAAKYIPDGALGLTRFHSELFELLTTMGVEIVTDDARRAAGLPPRDEYGMTADEMRALEWRRMEIMMRPISLSPILPFAD